MNLPKPMKMNYRIKIKSASLPFFLLLLILLSFSFALTSCGQKEEEIIKKLTTTKEALSSAADKMAEAIKESGSEIKEAISNDIKKTVGSGVKRLQQSAEKGDMAAQQALGVMYAYGRGVEKDMVKAYKWVSLASAKGMIGAEETLNRISRDMTESQIKKGKKLAQKWQKKH